MAIASSTNYYSSAIVGQPMAGADIDVLERNTTPRFPIGFGFERAEGNRFRYVHYGAAVAAGALVGCSNTNNNLFSIDAKVVAVATASAVANEIIKPGDIGSRYVQVTMATVANNQYAGGYFVTTKDTGSGYTYRIKGNTATGVPVTGDFRMELYEKIKVKLDNTTDIAITPSIYVDCDEVAGPVTGYTYAGVSMAAASADNWGWVCTKGPVGCLCSDAASVGQLVRPSGALGSVATGGTITNLQSPIVGYVLVPAIAAQQGIINLTLE